MVLVKLLHLDDGASLENTLLVYGVLGIASLDALVLAISHEFDFVKEAQKYGTERVRLRALGIHITEKQYVTRPILIG